MKKDKVKIGLALGGGGMCGFAHIGFMQVLEENGIKPDLISGVSMGSIIGGFYASGYTLEEIEKMAKSLKKNDLIALNCFKILKEGLASGKKIETFLNIKLKVKTLEECILPFYVGATNLKTGKSEYFCEGKLVQALRASTAIPSIFPAVKFNGTSYVDGGTSENVPFPILRDKGADVVIALDCIEPYSLKTIPKGSFPTLFASLNIMQYVASMNNLQINKDKVDIYCMNGTKGVTPQSLDFKFIPKVIESGRKCALQNIEKIKKIIKEKENAKV